MKIRGVYGIPQRIDDYEPDGATVGFNGVTRIEEFTENLGTYGITWFNIYKGDHQTEKMNALAVASVLYFEDQDA